MSKILIVEDDKELSDCLRLTLQAESFLVDVAVSGDTGLEALKFYKYDVVILDWELPVMSGVEICKQFRQGGGSTPIIMLTGRRTISDKEFGFETGCDDYLTKPFDLKELVVRVRALLRRPSEFIGDILRVGNVTLDTRLSSVQVRGNTISLQPMEYLLLEFLMRNYNQPFSPTALLDRVWKSNSDASVDTIRTYVKTLRRKIQDNDGTSILKTVHGFGYKVIG